MLKTVLFYTQYSRGWTETFYSADTDPLAFSKFLGPAFQKNMTSWRDSSTQLVGIRVSDILGLRPSVFLNLGTLIGGSPGGDNTVSAPDVVTTTAVEKITGTSGRVRRIFVRGVRDSDVIRSNTGKDSPSGALNAGLDRYFTQLSRVGFGILLTTQPPGGGLTWVQCLGARVSALGVGFTDILVPAVPAFLSPGVFARFRGVPTNDLPGFPRRINVVATDNAAAQPFFTVPYRYREPATITTPSMRVTAYQFTIDPFNVGEFDRFSEHKTGRPTTALRGRARSRVRAR